MGATNFEYGAQAIAPKTEVPPDFCGNSPAISAKTKLCISASTTDTVHTSGETAPTPAAIDPMEKSTSAGTPLAIQNPPVQPIERFIPPTSGSAFVATPGDGTVFDMWSLRTGAGWRTDTGRETTQRPCNWLWFAYRSFDAFRACYGLVTRSEKTPTAKDVPCSEEVVWARGRTVASCPVAATRGAPSAYRTLTRMMNGDHVDLLLESLRTRRPASRPRVQPGGLERDAHGLDL